VSFEALLKFLKVHTSSSSLLHSHLDSSLFSHSFHHAFSFGRELFTDTGQYVLRFRDLEPQELHTPSRVIETSSGNVIAANPQSSGSRGEVILKQDSRPMTLDERAISLAAAVSIDCEEEIKYDFSEIHEMQC